MFFSKYTSVHCIGIGGIGISAIAKFLMAQGKQVTGSDSHASDVVEDLRQRGIDVVLTHAAENLPDDCDLIIYSEAVPDSNPERVRARERGITQLGHFDFLGALSKEYRTICVTGTNGKSTTTAMLGKIFEEAGSDPTVFVGSLVPGWSLGNLRIGQGEFLIIEGDEYKQKMVKLFPETTLITNIEADHLDVYKDLNHIVATFQELAKKTRGRVFVNASDENSLKIAADSRVLYGPTGTGAAFSVTDRVAGEGAQTFTLKENNGGPDVDLGRIELHVPGMFNVMNALGAAAVARSYGCEVHHIQTALKNFSGIWRRFERVGSNGGAEVISDYAHHPTAIKATLDAVHEFFPGGRLVLLFEPHQHNRTKELFSDFVSAFDRADVLVLSEIYGVEGRTATEEPVAGYDLFAAIDVRPAAPPMRFFAHDLVEAEKLVRGVIKAGDIVIVMGAGDVDKVARRLVS